MNPAPQPQARFERRLRWLTFAVGVPGAALSLVLLWTGDLNPRLQATLTVALFFAWWILGALLVHRVVFPLQTLSNLLGGLREGDFSTRARGAVRDDALGEVLIEANALANTLREQRLGALEATALLRTVMEELDTAVFAFDQQQRLRLANRAAENLLRRPVEQLLDRTARELGLAGCLTDEPARTMSLSLPGALGRFSVRRSTFRQAGMPHQLLVLTDLSRALREEERLAWQRLVRVLGHELNNSLAPIKSLAGSLESLLAQQPLPEDWRSDARRGLGVIASRADSLTRFMQAYAQLTRLPAPEKHPIPLAPRIQRVASLATRFPVAILPGPAFTLDADGDQLEQLLINLLRNAADALGEVSPDPNAPAADPSIVIAWSRSGPDLELTVSDSGPGIANPANLFVPFFTTKPRGSGIGLSLCRQIAESHGGSLTLENHPDHPGCVARLRLPVADDVPRIPLPTTP